MTEIVFNYAEKPPKGWQDVDDGFFYRELKSGPQYLCRWCGEINSPRSPRYHKPGCPRIQPKVE